MTWAINTERNGYKVIMVQYGKNGIRVLGIRSQGSLATWIDSLTKT